MTNTIAQYVAAASTALAAVFAASNAQAAEPVEKLWFTDSHVSAFYAVNKADHRVIVVTEPGPQGQGHTTRTDKQLADGERFALSLDGHGGNALTATLTVIRSGKDMDVQVITTPRERSVAGGFETFDGWRVITPND